MDGGSVKWARSVEGLFSKGLVTERGSERLRLFDRRRGRSAFPLIDGGSSHTQRNR